VPVEAQTREGEVRSYGLNRFSYATRLVFAFILTAGMTAVILVGVLAIVWEQQFQTYSRENLQLFADSAATSLAQRYHITGSWTQDTLAGLQVLSDLAPEGTIKVVDANGIVLYDDLSARQEENPFVSINPQNGVQVQVPVIVDGGVAAGTVYVTALGGTSLSQNESQLRENSFLAMGLAGVIAIILSIIVGLIATRGMVKPLRRITQTVKEIKAERFSARTDLSGFDEIGRLGKTLDEMAETIEENRRYERQITADVAHELRTPLMAIQATVEAIVDGVLPASAEHLATIHAEVVRLGRLVDAQLRLSRLENKSLALKEKEVNLGDLIANLVLAHEMLIEESELSIEFNADPGVIVIGDPDLLRQATVNLLSNAVRYTPAGGVITIEVRRGQMMAHISVKDTGIGISADDIKHVFVKFWRSDGGRNRESGGLGIGLPMVKEIADRHNGWVNVESMLGKGSTFTIYIPLHTELQRRSNKGK